MSAQRAETIEERKQAGREALAAIRTFQDELRRLNPDFTNEDWDRLAEEWAEEVNESLRAHVLKRNAEWEQRSR